MTTGNITYNGTNMMLKTNDSEYSIGSIGDLYKTTTVSGCCDFWPSYLTYTPTYTTTVYRESKIDTAFKIVEKLMDNGHIKELAVKEFTKLVKEIADTL
jgi:hypothetical protein